MSKKYRVGRKQGRAVLDETGRTVIVFDSKEEAQEYCEWKNMGVSLDNKINYDEELLKQASELLQRIDKVQALSGKLLSIEMSLNRTLTEEEIKSLQLPKSPLKPLSELHKDEEACRKIFEIIGNERERKHLQFVKCALSEMTDDLHGVEISGNYSDVEGKKKKLEVLICNNGLIGLDDYGDRFATFNAFALVDLLRELGYGPENHP